MKSNGVLYGLVSSLLLLLGGCATEERISFNADIRPILNANCVNCHGGVKQSGGFGLVFRENALGEMSSGAHAIVPGKPGKSELVRRLRHENPELRMPYEGPPLPEEEIALLEKWIAQGAEWETHWAYAPVREVRPPEIDTAWGNNEIDRFVFARLQKADLAPAPRAQKKTLLRRLSLDLIGLPPTPEEMAAFVNGEETYAQAVKRLLNSPRFGEHWASMWLDLARYADSRGYERDAGRTIWRYRDWVIRAFNEDMPFDAFGLTQLAGDRLPDPGEDELIATAFHRNTLSNDEGGTNNEEYRVVTAIDRVNTSWEVWLGTTMACVQCHSHPYDPLRHEDFFRSFAFFNQSADHDHVTESPYYITYPQTEEAKLTAVEAWLQVVARPQVQSKWTKMLRTHEPRIRPYHFADVHHGTFTDRADEDYMFFPDGGYFRLPTRKLDDVGALHLSYRTWTEPPRHVEIRLDAPDGPLVGQAILERRPGAVSTQAIPLQPTAGEHRLYLVFRSAAEGKIIGIYSALFQDRLPGAERAGYAEVAAYVDELLAARDSVRTPIMTDLPADQARVTRVFDRGNWLVPTDTVRSGVPEIFPPLLNSIPHDRLAFANWVFRDENPLAARVAVNRFWARLFGRGIVPTLEDFGSQGAPPSHPALLDWLAGKFRGELGWSVKELLRLYVHSATYQQASAVEEDLLAADPYNELLARGPRVRLTAEQIRDQLLAASGLLSDKMYGPSVMPPQPEGLWDAVVYSGLRWKTSEGEDRHRRALYTYLRRSVPHPSLTTFDGTNREVCLSRRVPTNTPLQALLTLNDPAVLEAAVFLARDVAVTGATPEAKIAAVHERLLYRAPTPANAATLRELYRESLDHYTADPAATKALAGADTPELAALTVVVNALFNLDEFLTKS